jgi:hypothetical protein
MSILEAIHPTAERDVVDGLDAVTLAAGALEAPFEPSLGTVGAALRHAGVDLLDRRAYRGTSAVMGVPRLQPCATRLARDELIVGGRRVRLAGPPTAWRDEHDLDIHGLIGAHPGWSVHEADADGHVAGRRAPGYRRRRGVRLRVACSERFSDERAHGDLVRTTAYLTYAAQSGPRTDLRGVLTTPGTKKPPCAGGFREPSAGLEPATPSLPSFDGGFRTIPRCSGMCRFAG